MNTKSQVHKQKVISQFVPPLHVQICQNALPDAFGKASVLGDWLTNHLNKNNNPSEMNYITQTNKHYTHFMSKILSVCTMSRFYINIDQPVSIYYDPISQNM